MDFKSIYYPLTVEKYKNISIAAEKLNIKQPSLSKYIQNLSDNIGVDLFEMKGQELTVTYAGERYIYWAKKMIPMLERLNKVRSLEKMTTLRVVAPTDLSSYISPFVLRQFLERYNHVFVDMKELSPSIDNIESQEFDLAITTNRPSDDSYVVEPLITDEIILVTSQMHTIGNYAIWKEGCRYPWIDLELIRNESLIELCKDQKSVKIVLEYLDSNNIVVHPVMRSDNTHQAIRAAAVTDAVCFIPERLIRHHVFPEKVRKYSVGEPLRMNLYLVYKRDTKLMEYAGFFGELIKEFLD